MTDLLSSLEKAIALRLAPLETRGLNVLNSPKSCLGNARAEALFYFTDQDAGEDGSCKQSRTITLKVEIQACDQRSHQVAYPYIAAVDIMLNNFDPKVGRTGTIKFSRVGYVPFETKNGVLWIYDMTFTLKAQVDKVKNAESAIADLFDS